MNDAQPGVEPRRRVVTWKRLLLIGFSTGAGIAVAYASIFGIVKWYQARPVLAKKEWRTLDLPDRKIKAVLRTEWRDGVLKYKFVVAPDDKALNKVFDDLASATGDLISVSVYLRDVGGFALCKIDISGLSLVSGNTGQIAALESQGEEAECTRAKYIEAADWSFGGRFLPNLSERAPPTNAKVSAVTSPAKVIAPAPARGRPAESKDSGTISQVTPVPPADGGDFLTGFDFLNTHRLETRAGHTFVVEREGERDMAMSWATYDEVYGTSTKLKFSCESPPDCLIENERNGQAIHGRMIR